MIGHPKHVKKCLELGVDIICAQGGEGGGHTGDVPTTILIPAVVDLVKGSTSPMTGKPVQVVAAGGIYNGQTVAAALMLGASAVWVGTRFILTDEAGAPKAHQEAVRTAGHDDNVRTIIFTGRPLRVRSNPYINNWEQNRAAEIKELTSKGVIPVEHDFETLGDDIDDDVSCLTYPGNFLFASILTSRADNGQCPPLPHGQGRSSRQREEERQGRC
jgi:NAD(P)H-dependent flavin oxidoreductase YrpB (nitropropane dioxygenase family)